MGIYVHVGDATDPVACTQVLDGHAAIVEDTEPAGAVTTRVVESGNRHERASTVARHNGIHCRHHRAHHEGGCLVDTPEGRCVTVIERPFTGARTLPDETNVGRVVKALYQRLSGHCGLASLDSMFQPAAQELFQKGGVAPGPERMLLSEVVSGKRITRVDPDLAAGGHERFPAPLRSIMSGNPGRRQWTVPRDSTVEFVSAAGVVR